MPLHLLALELRSHECTHRDYQTHARVVFGNGSGDFELAGSPRGNNQGIKVARWHRWRDLESKEV